MEYGVIFAGAWRTIWREKRLWLFGLLGLLLAAIGSAAYLAFSMNWQRDYFAMIGRLTAGGRPEAFAGQMIGSMTWLWLGIGLLMLASLIGYLINLVMRAATIHEAALAWNGVRSDVGRGVQAGFARGIYVFLLDLLWFVPSIIIWGGGYLLAIIALIGLGATSSNGSGAGTAVLGFCGILCGTGCLGLLVLLAQVIFAPLMYQSAVQGRRGAGAAIAEGWQLARTHLGPMIIFWLLSLVVSFGLGLILQLITLPFLFPLFGSYIAFMTQITENAGRGNFMPTFPSLSGPLVFMLAVAIGLGSWLTNSLKQTFDLTMYAAVYRRLTGGAVTVSATPPAPTGPSLAPLPPLEPTAPAEATAVSEPAASPDVPAIPPGDLIVPDEETSPDEGDARPYV
jgi:hypothetical protein